MVYSAVSSLAPMVIVPLNLLLSTVGILNGNWMMVAVYSGCFRYPR